MIRQKIVHSPAPSSRAASSNRKSTRLNSSHLVISYAVFCLKKKKKYQHRKTPIRPCTRITSQRRETTRPRTGSPTQPRQQLVMPAVTAQECKLEPVGLRIA